jgi:ribA/ribD-fused uncharacterized protein
MQGIEYPHRRQCLKGNFTMNKNAAGKTTLTKQLTSTAVRGDIPFYRANEKPYGAFSNLFRREIVFEDRIYPTAEHAYQAGKARKEEVREWILSAPTPALVAMAAHGLYTWDIVPEWSQLKFERMRQVLYAKFTQHEDLKKLLLSTGTARLVEAGKVPNAVNCTWGEVNGKGKNMLGVLLMELRSELRKPAPNSSTRPKQVPRRPKSVQPSSRVSGSAVKRGAVATTA